MGSVLNIFSTDTDPVYKDIRQNINFDVVLSIYSSMHKKAEESSIQYSRGSLCQRRSQDVFIGVAREGPATSLGWHINLQYLNIKM